MRGHANNGGDAKVSRHFKYFDDLAALAAGRKRDHYIVWADQTKVPVSRLGRVNKIRWSRGRTQGGCKFFRNMASFANARG